MIDAPKSISACAEYYADEYYSVRKYQMDCEKISNGMKTSVKTLKIIILMI